jgi:hypothetical protein
MYANKRCSSKVLSNELGTDKLAKYGTVIGYLSDYNMRPIACRAANRPHLVSELIDEASAFHGIT